MKRSRKPPRPFTPHPDRIFRHGSSRCTSSASAESVASIRSDVGSAGAQGRRVSILAVVAGYYYTTGRFLVDYSCLAYSTGNKVTATMLVVAMTGGFDGVAGTDVTFQPAGILVVHETAEG